MEKIFSCDIMRPKEVFLMRKVFLATLFALMMSFQNFCGAQATIESSSLDDNGNFNYPIVHTGNSAVDKKINKVIFGLTQNFLMELKTDRREHGINITVEKTSFVVNSNDAANSNVLSLNLYQSKYGSNGPAHPTNYAHALNFDLTTGERLTTDDLSKFGYGDKDSLYQKLITKLKERSDNNERRGMLTLSVNSVKSLPENFYFDENFHLHFLFEQNSIAHYAVGAIDIDMDE